MRETASGRSDIRSAMKTTWVDVHAARKRLTEIETELQTLSAERALIEMALNERGSPPRDAGGKSQATRPASARPRRRRRWRARRTTARTPRQPAAKAPASSRSSFTDLIVEALRQGAPGGRTVAEVMRHIEANHPERVSAANASALTSAAIAQARKAKVPRIKVLKQGGPGVPSRYGAV